MRTVRNSTTEIIMDWAETVVFSVFLVLFCFIFIFRVACVQGESMENTLFENDRLVISHLFYTPERGDIVVINSRVMNETIIKRVIATSNQKVVIDYRNGTVSVDGEVIDEPYIKESMWQSGIFASEFYDPEKDAYEYDVPLGYVFVMGDNRNNSTDSRVIGYVPEEEILGRVMFRIYSQKAGVGKVD